MMRIRHFANVPLFPHFPRSANGHTLIRVLRSASGHGVFAHAKTSEREVQRASLAGASDACPEECMSVRAKQFLQSDGLSVKGKFDNIAFS